MFTDVQQARLAAGTLLPWDQPEPVGRHAGSQHAQLFQPLPEQLQAQGNKNELEKKGIITSRLEFVIHKKIVDTVRNIAYSYSLPIVTV
jgi:hypothetical protein